MLLQQLNQWEFTSSNEWGVRSTVLECFTLWALLFVKGKLGAFLRGAGPAAEAQSNVRVPGDESVSSPFVSSGPIFQ